MGLLDKPLVRVRMIMIRVWITGVSLLGKGYGLRLCQCSDDRCPAWGVYVLHLDEDTSPMFCLGVCPL